MNYYQRHIGDYAKKAGHLSPLEHGVYCLLLDAYYDREQGPTKAEALRWARARSPEEVAATETVLFEFFKFTNGRYKQSRVEEEFGKWEEYQRKQQVNGKKGGRPRKANANPNKSGGFSTETQTKPKITLSTNPLIHYPLTTKEQELESKDLCGKPHGFETFWQLFPRKTAKQVAAKAWAKNRLEPESAVVVAGLTAQLSAGMFQETQFTPHGATYLNGRRWEDPPERKTAPIAQPSKGLQAIQRLQGISNAMDHSGNIARIEQDDFAGARPNPGDGFD